MRTRSPHNFGDIVVVENGNVGVVVKCWGPTSSGNPAIHDTYNFDVYVRSYNAIKNYIEHDVRHFIYDKELSDEDLEYYE